MTTTFRNKTVVCAVIGFAGLAGGFAIDPRTALASYLVAWTVVCAVSVGALAVLFTSYLVRAGWTHDLRGLLSTAALTLPAVGVLFIPVLIGMAHLYPWVSDPAHLQPFKAAYLTPWFFTLRAILYFAVDGPRSLGRACIWRRCRDETSRVGRPHCMGPDVFMGRGRLARIA